MTVEQALEFFSELPRIKRKIQALFDVGLGYIRLGQQATTLSGGEAQRVKLATELSKVSTGKTLYILDEPTTGLHFEDVKILLIVLNKLVDKGNTVVIVEHNLDVIKVADYVIDLGPGGGEHGGEIIAEGTPEEISNIEKSLTGKYLKKELLFL
jgi:excinuclease ABC subunit A